MFNIKERVSALESARPTGYEISPINLASNLPSRVASMSGHLGVPQTERKSCELHTPVIAKKTCVVADVVTEVHVVGGVIHGIPIPSDMQGSMLKECC